MVKKIVLTHDKDVIFDVGYKKVEHIDKEITLTELINIIYILTKRYYVLEEVIFYEDLLESFSNVDLVVFFTYINTLNFNNQKLKFKTSPNNVNHRYKTDSKKDEYKLYKEYYDYHLSETIPKITGEDIIKFTNIASGTFYDLHKKIYSRDYYIAVGIALKLSVEEMNGLLERRTYCLSATFDRDRAIVDLIKSNRTYKDISEFNFDLKLKYQEALDKAIFKEDVIDESHWKLILKRG